MKKTLLTQALCASVLIGAIAAPVHAGEAELMQKIEKLAAELDAIKAELAANRKKTESVAQKQEALASSVASNTASSAAANSAANSPMQSSPQTVISSYGEISYTRPRNASNETQADVGRAVLGIAHRFDEKNKVVAEFEWEHAVTSKDDNGEAAVEQLYVEHELDNGLRAKGGLFLMPVGMLNTSHEPTAFFGVHRNFVETAIIPTTWREVGFALSGAHDNGISWDAGVTTGFDLANGMPHPVMAPNHRWAASIRKASWPNRMIWPCTRR